MVFPQAAREHDADQKRVAAYVIAEVRRLWGARAPSEFDDWFAANVSTLTGLVALGQQRAVRDAEPYVAGTLDELGTPVDPDAAVDASRLVGVASDGRALDTLMYGAVIGAKVAVGEGASPRTAWLGARDDIVRRVGTQLADTARAAVGLSITVREGVGYVRMLSGSSCSRCIVLAGRWYRKASFQRHPACDCRNVASRRTHAQRMLTDPKAAFDRLDAAGQDAVFGAAAAAAIREGADVAQVVDARRGMAVAGRVPRRARVLGRDLLITTEGATRRGLFGRSLAARGRSAATTPRLMPEAIYELAQDRADVLRLLRLNGYIR